MLSTVSMQATSLCEPATAATGQRDPNAHLAVLHRLGRRFDGQDPRAAHEAAAMLTSQLFFAPLLAEMRKMPLGKGIGYGGRMEEAFGEQLDQRLADVVARADRGLTEQVSRRLTRGAAATTTVAEPRAAQATWPAEQQARATSGGDPT